MFQLSPRQIHLDFHTSEHIPGIGADFDPQAFAKAAKDANVSSMTVFARGHHGWLYYESELFPELVHPNLKCRDLLQGQIRALHAEGIRAPIYITVQWDYHSSATRPEWLIRQQNGAHEGSPFEEPGFYQSLCVNTGYFDFLKAMTGEICGLLGSELDGIFFDIVGIRPCWCAACRAKMKKTGVDASNEAQVRAFAGLVMDRFKHEMTAFVRQNNANCSIFYNAGHVGPCTRASKDSYTHLELESLPSGSWGYLHFPVAARYARTLGLDCMGMTGKFHTTWGDFHSLKNLAALEFECFRMLSYGFACSVGDQLEPRGTLNPATYRLIGKVYSQIEAREAWARPSKAMSEVALMTAEPQVSGSIPESIFGAVQLLEELAVQFDILDDAGDLSAYKLMIIPDDFRVDDAFSRKLDAFVKAGGHVLACGHGALNAAGQYPACFHASYAGDTAAYPDFIIAEGALARELIPDNEYVIYLPGVQIKPDGGEIALAARAPYFKREGDHFCSHQYAPSAKGETYPAAVRGAGTLLFSHPLFTQYRQNAPHWVKTFVKNALDELLPNRLVEHNGPSTLSVQMLDQPQSNRVTAHILTYVPVRKSATIDIIEERTKVQDLTFTFRLPGEFNRARLVPENADLKVDGDMVYVPCVDGYAIIELTR